MTDMDALIAAADALEEAGQDFIRASNTLMLMLAGGLDMTKASIELAIRRALDARNAWDAANITYRAARDAVGKPTPPAFATPA